MLTPWRPVCSDQFHSQAPSRSHESTSTWSSLYLQVEKGRVAERWGWHLQMIFYYMKTLNRVYFKPQWMTIEIDDAVYPVSDEYPHGWGVVPWSYPSHHWIKWGVLHPFKRSSSHVKTSKNHWGITVEQVFILSQEIAVDDVIVEWTINKGWGFQTLSGKAIDFQLRSHPVRYQVGFKCSFEVFSDGFGCVMTREILFNPCIALIIIDWNLSVFFQIVPGAVERAAWCTETCREVLWSELCIHLNLRLP